MKMRDFALAGAVLSLSGGAALADMVSFCTDASTSTNTTATGASLDGSIEYTYTGGNSGQLIFSVTNTTDSSVGGFFTGLVFNIGSSDSGATATLSATSDADFRDTGVEAANPFGIFDAGAALKANWSGGGNPSKGIGAGLSAMFTFTILASDASSLSVMDFLGDGDDIAIRFRGLVNGQSDKLLIEEPPLNIVPLPAPALAGGAMLGLCLASRRLRARG